MSEKGLKTDAGQLNELHSSKEGVGHWRMQRVTAIVLIPMTVWFIISIASLTGANYSETIEWITSPFVAIFMILFSITMLYHAFLGIQVVVEDYIHTEGLKLAVLIGSRLIFGGLGIATVFSIAKLVL